MTYLAYSLQRQRGEPDQDRRVPQTIGALAGGGARLGPRKPEQAG